MWFSLFTPQVGHQWPRRCWNRMSGGRRLRTWLHCANISEAGHARSLAPPVRYASRRSRGLCFRVDDGEPLRRSQNQNHALPVWGNPDCKACGCIASMGLSAIAAHKFAGILPVGAIFRASVKMGRARGRENAQRPLADETLRVLR